MPPNTPAGYLDENGVPVVWNNPQAAALDWQQRVDWRAARRYNSADPPVNDIPSLQIWPNGLPSAYGILSRHLEPEWDGYYRMGPGYSDLPMPSPVTALGPRLQARINRIPF